VHLSPALSRAMLTAPKLRSPSLPLLHPRDPLALIVDLAERCPESLPAAAAWPTNIVWSAAEGVIISADIYLEKTLFDAFRPLNATVNAVLAAVTALSTEAIAKGVLNVPEEDEDESQREAMDWTAVAQGTGLNFARESTALTLQRAAEKISKPRVSPAAHREMIKHLPKMARRHYISATADSGSKWRAGASTSLAVLRSPAFYILRSSSALAADVAVDGMRVAYGTLSKHAFRQNALLKLLKHGLSCACCIAAGCLLPMTLGVQSHLFFIISDLVGSSIADQVLSLLGRTIA